MKLFSSPRNMSSFLKKQPSLTFITFPTSTRKCRMFFLVIEYLGINPSVKPVGQSQRCPPQRPAQSQAQDPSKYSRN